MTVGFRVWKRLRPTIQQDCAWRPLSGQAKYFIQVTGEERAEALAFENAVKEQIEIDILGANQNPRFQWRLDAQAVLPKQILRKPRPKCMREVTAE